jgi:hypothetical protein
VHCKCQREAFMMAREAKGVYYAESFCGLSETYVYRTARPK